MIKPITTPGKTYAVTSPNGCTATQHVGEVDIVTDVPAGLQTLIIAHASRFEIDDDSAIVTECGGSAELVFTAATARAASSGTGCDCGFTAEECDKLKLYASAEGRNIPISEDGEIITQIGHTYTITAGEQAVKCTDADFNPLCEVAAHKQMGFIAPSTAAYVDPVTCTVTEVFRAAAPIMLSGNGSGESGGDDGLPAGYMRVDWISNNPNNKTAYIDTGIIANETTSVKLLSQVPYTRFQWESCFGVRDGVDEINAITIWPWNEGNCGVNRNGEKFETSYSSEWRSIEISPTKIIVDTEMMELNKTESFTSNGTMLLFTRRERGNVVFGYTSYTLVSSLIIAEGDNCKLSFVPCLDETGAPCMFDLVSRKPFYNEGEGDFLYPTESATYSLRPAERYIPEFAQLTPNGVRRLYKTPDWYDGSIEEYAAAYGFKPIVETEQPTEGYWAPQWRETEEEIILDWIETEAPEMEEV
jgi:hypothetical protein